MHYETFLFLFNAAMFFYGALTQSDRRALASWEGQAFNSLPGGRVLKVFSAFGHMGWVALMVIGFFSLQWYLVLISFVAIGGLGGIAYTVITVRPTFHAGTLHNVAAGAFGALVVTLTAILWANRLA